VSLGPVPSSLGRAAELRPWLVLTAALVALIGASFALLEQPLAQVLDGFRASGPSAVAVAAAVIAALALDVVLPIPSTIVTTLAGGVLGAGAGTAAAWLGMSLGSAAAFWLGRRGGRTLEGRLLSTAQLARAERAAAQHGVWAVVVLRPVPVLAELSAIYAGMAGMPWRRFLWSSALANLGICGVYAGIGARAADAELFLLAVLASVAIPGVALLLARRARGLA
jgi:3-dehydroquinate synthase